MLLVRDSTVNVTQRQSCLLNALCVSEHFNYNVIYRLIRLSLDYMFETDECKTVLGQLNMS